MSETRRKSEEKEQMLMKLSQKYLERLPKCMELPYPFRSD